MSPRVALAAVMIAFALLAAACGSNGGNTTTGGGGSTTQPTTTGPPTVALTVYSVAGNTIVPRRVVVPSTRAVAAAALHALGIDAPVRIANGTATVDLPTASDSQIAEIVYTLTQFRTVTQVDVGGRTGLTRADEASFSPPILVEAPAAGATVPLDVTVAGTAQVFEASLVVELRRGGKLLDRTSVTASAGAPERGSFAATLHAPSPGPATVVAYAPSAADGSPQHQVEVPITVGP